MKENKKTIQVLAIVTLLIAVVCISVGFALMSTSLRIEGSAKIIPAKWSVHYVVEDNTVTPNVPSSLAFSNNSTTACEAHATGCVTVGDGETAPSAPTFTTSTFSDYQIVLKKPGDKGTYTFDITNDGDIDAVVSGVNNANLSATAKSTLTFAGDADDVAKVEDYVTYKVTWSDGSAIQNTDELLHGQTRTVKVEVEYLSTATDLPSAPVTVTGRDVTITFTQKNS